MNIRIRICLIIFIFCIGKTFSQADSSKSFGFTYENNQSNVGNSYYGTRIIGFSLGLQYIWQCNTYTSIITGLDYQRKGGTQRINFFNIQNDVIGGYDQNLYLHYLSLPLLLRLQTKLGNKVSVSGSFGGYYAYLVKAWLNPQKINYDHDVSGQYNKSDVGIILSAGLAYHFSAKQALELSIRNTTGFMNVSNSYSGTNQSNGLSLSYYYMLN